MDRLLCFACAIALASLAGCASRPVATNAMGAGPGCDLRIDVGADHRCAVTHVTPPDPQAQLANQVQSLELHSAPTQRP
jgi:hypothetical protein